MKENKPKISVITVSYNCVDNIEDTILSVIHQDYPNIEYLIIDGGSKDGTIDIIKRYEKSITYWISEPDNGLYDAMNKGIMMATGEWVTMRNCGDVFAEKGALSKLFDKHIPTDVDFVCAAAYRITDLGYYIAKSRQMTSLNSGMTVVHPATFVRLKLHQQRLFDTRFTVCADYNLIYTSVKDGHKIEIRNIPIVVFPQGGFSSVHWDLGFRQGRIIRGYTSITSRVFTELKIVEMKFMRRLRHLLKKLPFIEKTRNKYIIKKYDIKPLPLPINKFY